MTEELNRKADHLSSAYKTKYSEDRTLKDMLSRPKDFVEGAIEGIINLLRQKAWRDGYIAGAIENGILWHDLRKDPNDLPAKGEYVLNQDGCMVKYCNQDNLEWMFCAAPNDELYQIAEVLRWCEIPQFKE